MDLLNSVSQCHFCTHLNTSFATQCELCHELLSVENMVVITELTTPRLCRHCGRRLLYNQRTCAFCNAHWAAAPIGTVPLLDSLRMDLVRLTIVPFPHSPPVLPEPVLSAPAREQYLTPIPVDSSCTTSLCSVCLEVIAVMEDSQVDVVQLPCCRNKFHGACVQPWFARKSSCPTCREDLNHRALTS